MVSNEVILAALKQLKQEGPKTARSGICMNICAQHRPEHDISLDEATVAIADASEQWVEYAGSRNYPVEGSAYQYGRHVNKWSGRYGPARKRLLDFLIKHFEEKMQ